MFALYALLSVFSISFGMYYIRDKFFIGVLAILFGVVFLDSAQDEYNRECVCSDSIPVFESQLEEER